MKVIVGKRAYSMTPQKWKEMLKMASEQVPFGIYAIEKRKASYGELRNDKAKSITQLKRQIREWEAQGYKVYANKGR